MITYSSSLYYFYLKINESFRGSTLMILTIIFERSTGCRVHFLKPHRE